MTSLLFLLTTWTVETIVTDTQAVAFSLALDSACAPYVLVSKGIKPLDLGYLHLYFKNSGNWLVDTIESNKVVYGGTIAIDRNNHIWCSYILSFDTIDYHIVAHKDTLNWIKDTVEIRLPNQATICGLTIDIDSHGIPHTIYQGWANFNPQLRVIYHAFLQDTIWQKEIVDSCHNVNPLVNALDVDAQNRIHTSYFCITGPISVELNYAQKIGSNWYYEMIDSLVLNDPWGLVTSIRINPITGFPGIACENPEIYQLQYVYYNGTSWITDSVHPWACIASKKALDFDTSGNPHISYNAGYATGCSSFVAYKDSLGWHRVSLPPLTPPLMQYWSNELRIDRDNTIHMIAKAADLYADYHEVHYIYGKIEPGIKDGDELKRKGGIFMVLPSLVKDNALIQFINPEKQRISLKLYDIVGREVMVIAERIAEAGIHSCSLNTTHLSSGIYFLVLKGDKETKTQKILIVR